VAGTSEGPAWREHEHEVERWCRLLVESGIAADPSDRGLAVPPVPAPPAAVGATIVHPGASAPARRWPAERFAAVARAEARADPGLLRITVDEVLAVLDQLPQRELLEVRREAPRVREKHGGRTDPAVARR